MREPLEAAGEGRVRPIRSVTAPAARFAVTQETFEYETEHALQFIDITEEVRAAVERAGIVAGQVSVNSMHTTAAVIVNEHEPLLLNDMARVLSRLAPPGDYYEHNDFSIRTVNMHDDEPANGHAHCQHLFLGASVTVPIQDGQMILGSWQSIFFVELDHARPRSVLVQAMGLAAE
ncbi:MAG: YjbQ family protein [Dehalococcoidia bacterium]|nr:YjbQ family protein [Dehalococcoidia bacterium]